MHIKKEIFKEYDIRGVYPSEVNKELAYAIGRNLSRLIGGEKNQKIVVGQDMRKASSPLTKSLIDGLISSGVDVLDIGVVTTPMLYFAILELNAGGGIMTTASHNPQKHDGFKIVRRNGMPIGGQELQSLHDLLQKDLPAPAPKPGKHHKAEVTKRYFDALFKDFSPSGSVKVSVDYGDGTAKLFSKELNKRLSQGNKPGQKADFYASFDYDADRLLISDEKKNEMRGDIVGAIVGDTLLKKNDKLVYEPRVSWGVRKHFLNKGVKTALSRVGHYNIKKTMSERKAVLGIEITGHIYFGRLNYSEAPFLTLRYIMEALDQNPGKKISEIFKPFGDYYHSGAIDLKIKNSAEIIEKLKNFYKRGAQDYLDGLTVEFPDRWWFNIRPSNTEPVVRLVVEANSPELLKEKIKEIKELINSK